jgi:tRNA G18 (ribose-2'-O)-methylase SpoU
MDPAPLSLAVSAAAAWDDSRLAEPTLLKYNVHTPLQTLPLTQVQRIAEASALPVGLMLFNLHGDMNVGMSIRTAVILGCSDVYIVGRRKYDRRSEVGAKNYIRVHRFQTIEPLFFQQNKLVPIFLEQGGTALEDFSFKPYLPGKLEEGWKLVFVVGSESFGLPPELMRSLKAPVLSISQYGVLRSLNVSIAASIVLYEYAKQWRQSVCI